MPQSKLPRLRYSEFSYPWSPKALGEFADVSKLAGYEFTKHVVYRDTGNYIGLRGLNIKNNGLDLSNVKYVDSSDLSKLSRSKLYVGDLMFTYVGTIGGVALIQENDRYYLAPNVARIRINTEVAIPEFVDQYFMNSNFRSREIEKRIATGSQPSLSMSNIRMFELYIPTKEEQQKISDFLTTVDEKIAALEQKAEKLQDYKHGMMQKIFSQQIRFTRPDGSSFPEWETKKLSEIMRESRVMGEKGSISKKITVKLWGKGVFAKTDQNGSVNTQYYTRHAGQFIYSKLDFLNCAFGIIPAELDGFGSTVDLPAFDIKPSYSGKFLLERIMRKDFYKRLGETADGSRKAKRIHADTFLGFTVSIPVYEEQQKIADFLSAIDAKITLTKSQVQKTKEFKKGLLQRMFV